MKPLLVLSLALLSVGAAAAPVHIALKSTASVSPAADFFSLGSVAALTGGDPALRARLAKVAVGRVPLPGDVRHLTRGDLTLKLRQAGFQPGQDTLLEGATNADVTVAASDVLPAPIDGAAGAQHAAPVLLIHRGDPVTICINDGDMKITAKGVARDNGTAGDTIHIHRNDCLTDLTVTVLDAQTVQLEP